MIKLEYTFNFISEEIRKTVAISKKKVLKPENGTKLRKNMSEKLKIKKRPFSLEKHLFFFGKGLVTIYFCF
ncbi:TPA: hypothetical protein HA351_11470 [Methanosarcinaceae archaeon]|nr:hypothetical protein [Methanosarcinaceae archaeon]